MYVEWCLAKRSDLRPHRPILSLFGATRISAKAHGEEVFSRLPAGSLLYLLRSSMEICFPSERLSMKVVWSRSSSALFWVDRWILTHWESRVALRRSMLSTPYFPCDEIGLFIAPWFLIFVSSWIDLLVGTISHVHTHCNSLLVEASIVTLPPSDCSPAVNSSIFALMSVASIFQDFWQHCWQGMVFWCPLAEWSLCYCCGWLLAT